MTQNADYQTSSDSDLYLIDRMCSRADAPEISCNITEIEHYGLPTGHLWCAPHGEVVGWHEPPPNSRSEA